MSGKVHLVNRLTRQDIQDIFQMREGRNPSSRDEIAKCYKIARISVTRILAGPDQWIDEWRGAWGTNYPKGDPATNPLPASDPFTGELVTDPSTGAMSLMRLVKARESLQLQLAEVEVAIRHELNL